MEAEFSFTNAVGKYTRAAVMEGNSKRNIVTNVKEQLSSRARLEEKRSCWRLTGGEDSGSNGEDWRWWGCGAQNAKD